MLCRVVTISAVALSVLAMPAAAQQDTTAQALVMVAGSGIEPHIQRLLDDAVDLMKEKGIRARIATEHSGPRSLQVDRMAAVGASSLLYLSLDEEGLLIQCYDKQGTLLWKEKARGGVHTTFNGAVRDMSKSMKERLSRRVGQPGLVRAP